MKDDLSLIVGERKISGWTAVRVSRSVERVPGDFDIGLTERYPGETEGLVVQPGDPCKVLLGDDLVITGYVDRYRPSVSAGMHGIRICGRGKCQDLVDCSAEWPGSQISGATALGIAKRLAKPYGITVSGKPGPEVPKFILSYGRIGLSPDGGASWQLMQRLPRSLVLQLLWLSEPITAQQLHVHGIVNWVTAKGQSLTQALEVADRLAQ